MKVIFNHLSQIFKNIQYKTSSKDLNLTNKAKDIEQVLN